MIDYFMSIMAIVKYRRVNGDCRNGSDFMVMMMLLVLVAVASVGYFVHELECETL